MHERWQNLIRKIRHWLIRVVVGKMPVAMNTTIYGEIWLSSADQGYVRKCVFRDWTERPPTMQEEWWNGLGEAITKAKGETDDQEKP